MASALVASAAAAAWWPIGGPTPIDTRSSNIGDGPPVAAGAPIVATARPDDRRAAIDAPVDEPPEARARETCSINGVVHEASGEPIAGARVVLARGSFDGAAIEEALTDRNGCFSFARIDPADRFPAVVLAEGRLPVWRYVGCSSTPIEVELVAHAALQGQVVDQNGRPVAEARVSTKRWASQSHQNLRKALGDRAIDAHAVSDANGAFVLEPVPIGESLEVFADADGYVSVGRRMKVSERAAPLALKMSRGSEVKLSVIDALTHQPLSGATVTSVSTRNVRRTAADGTVRWRAPNDHQKTFVIVNASADGYCGRQHIVYSSKFGGALQHIELRRGTTVGGTVLDSGGRPIAGANVRLGPTHRDAAIADAQGRFLFDGVPIDEDGPWTLSAKSTWATTREPLVLPVVPEGYRSVALSLPSSGAIAGRITASGAPVRATVVAFGREGKRRKDSSADGTYRLTHLAPGNWRVTVLLDSRQVGKVDGSQGTLVRVEAARATTFDHDIPLGATSVLAGRVELPSGEPFKSTVKLSSGYSHRGTELAFTTSTDASGRFRFGVPASTDRRWRAVANVRGVWAKASDIAAPNESIVLRPPEPSFGHVGVRLRDIAGEVVPLERLHWCKPDGKERWDSEYADQDPAGVYWLKIPAGIHDLKADPASPRHFETVHRGILVEAGETQQLELEVETGALVYVRWINASGEPEVPIEWPFPHSIDNSLTEMAPEGPGVFSAGPLRPGRYEFDSTRSIDMSPRSFELQPGEIKTVNVTWRITDQAGYEQLEREHAEFEELRKAGLVCDF